MGVEMEIRGQGHRTGRHDESGYTYCTVPGPPRARVSIIILK